MVANDPGPSPAPSATRLGREQRSLTAREYAWRVFRHSQPAESLFPGLHYHDLAGFLRGAYQQRASTKTASTDLPDATLLSVHAFTGSGPPRVSHGLDALSQQDSEALPAGTLIFLRGHQPPDVLNTLGARFLIDPEFFRRHLDFDRAQGRVRHAPQPSLPSVEGGMVRLLLTTVGSRASPGTSGLRDTAHLREKIASEMAAYSEMRRREDDLWPGRSTVRAMSLHDGCHFSFEQDMSIYMDARPDGWIALVWLDVGSDLGCETGCAWHPDTLKYDGNQVEFWPVPQHRPGVALELPRCQPPTNNTGERDQRQGHGQEQAEKVAQSAALLHRDYGSSLDPKTMAVEPFYALTELFRFAAFSELQFLGLLDYTLKQDLDPVVLSQKSVNLMTPQWNLMYNKQVLEHHIGRLDEILLFLNIRYKARGSNKIANRAARDLLADYNYLIERARLLAAAYENGMNILMNNAMVSESQKAILQAEGIAQLTGLAFFFIPLSLTASVFGMNIAQFNPDSPLSIWAWILTSIITLAIAYLFLNWRTWRVHERLFTLNSSRKPDSYSENHLHSWRARASSDAV